MLLYSFLYHIYIHHNIIIIILLLMNFFHSYCNDNEYNLLKIFARCVSPSLAFHCKDFARAFQTAGSAVIQCSCHYSCQNNDWIGWNLLLYLLWWHLQ